MHERHFLKGNRAPLYEEMGYWFSTPGAKALRENFMQPRLMNFYRFRMCCLPWFQPTCWVQLGGGGF